MDAPQLDAASLSCLFGCLDDLSDLLTCCAVSSDWRRAALTPSLWAARPAILPVALRAKVDGAVLRRLVERAQGKLTSLSLDGCVLLTNADVALLATTRLRFLSVVGCTSLTGAGVRAALPPTVTRLQLEGVDLDQGELEALTATVQRNADASEAAKDAAARALAAPTAPVAAPRVDMTFCPRCTIIAPHRRVLTCATPDSEEHPPLTACTDCGVQRCSCGCAEHTFCDDCLTSAWRVAALAFHPPTHSQLTRGLAVKGEMGEIWWCEACTDQPGSPVFRECKAAGAHATCSACDELVCRACALRCRRLCAHCNELVCDRCQPTVTAGLGECAACGGDVCESCTEYGECGAPAAEAAAAEEAPSIVIDATVFQTQPAPPAPLQAFIASIIPALSNPQQVLATMRARGITLDDLRELARAQRDTARSDIERENQWVEFLEMLNLTQPVDFLRMRHAVQAL